MKKLENKFFCIIRINEEKDRVDITKKELITFKNRNQMSTLSRKKVLGIIPVIIKKSYYIGGNVNYGCWEHPIHQGDVKYNQFDKQLTEAGL